MIYFIYGLIFLAVIFFVSMVPVEEKHVSIIKTKKRSTPKDVFFKIFTPINALNAVFLRPLPAIERRLKDTLSFVKWGISPAEFLSVKELLVVVLAVGLYIYLPEDIKIFIVPAAFIIFFIPDLILKSKVKARKESIVRVLPETVDLLSLCVSAGLDFMASVRWITAKAHSNPMIEELKSLLEEIRIGRSKMEALKGMSKRLNIPEVSSFVRNLIQAERMGTPVEETFQIISDDVRMRRSYRGKREAMKSSIKMLIPLIVFILPVILIIVAGPILISFMKGGIGNLVK